MSPKSANISFTNLLDTDMIVLSYIEPSYLAHIKTTNKYFYSTIAHYFSNKYELLITKDLICAHNFVKNNFNNFVEKEKWLLNKCIDYVLDLEDIKWLISKGLKPTYEAFTYAAKNGNLENMKWMLQNNFPKDIWTFAYAIINGNLENMKWMLHNNFPKDEETFARAAENGNLENMKWMLQNDFPKNEWTFKYAIKNGNFENMKWMIQNNFPYDNNDYNKYTRMVNK